MNCREFLKRMPELLDRGPNPAATDALMEHASICPTCAAELDAALRVLATVSPSLPLKASPGLKERTMKQIMILDSQPNATRPASTGRGASIVRRWSLAAAAAAVLALLALAILKGGSSNAFAQAMEQLRKATACVYTMTVTTQGAPPTRMKTYFKDPGGMRIESSAPGISGLTGISIVDANRKKLITLMPLTKQCLSFDLTGDASATEQTSMLNQFEELRRIPDSGAQPVGTKDIGGIQAQGFRASLKGVTYVIWIDPASQRLLLVECQFDNIKDVRAEMTDFNFDANLDDSLFSLDPPAGYTVTDGKSLKVEAPSEETLIRFLRNLAEESEGDLFPPSLDQAGIMESMKSRKKTAPKLPAAMSPEFMKRTHEITLGLMFVMQMTPENDFHYVGKGVALGDAQTPICWYKPTGAQNYRVIYGDLSVRETAPENLPAAAAQ